MRTFSTGVDFTQIDFGTGGQHACSPKIYKLTTRGYTEWLSHVPTPTKTSSEAAITIAWVQESGNSCTHVVRITTFGVS